MDLEDVFIPDVSVTESGFSVPSASPDTYRDMNYYEEIQSRINEYKKSEGYKSTLDFLRATYEMPRRFFGTLWTLDMNNAYDRGLFRSFKEAWQHEASVKFRYTDLPAIKDAYKSFYAWWTISHERGKFNMLDSEVRDEFVKRWDSKEANNWIKDNREILSLPFEFMLDLAWAGTAVSKIASKHTMLKKAKGLTSIADDILKMMDPLDVKRILVYKTSGAYPIKEVCESLVSINAKKAGAKKVAGQLATIGFSPFDKPYPHGIIHRFFRPKTKLMVPGLFEDIKSIKSELSHWSRWYQGKMTEAEGLQRLLTGSPTDKARKINRVYQVLQNPKYKTLGDYASDLALGRARLSLSTDEYLFAKGLRDIYDDVWLLAQKLWPKIAKRKELSRPYIQRISKLTGKRLGFETKANELIISGLGNIPQARSLTSLYNNIWNGSPDVAKIADRKLKALLQTKGKAGEIYRNIDELLRVSASGPPYRHNYVKGTGILKSVVKPAVIRDGLKSYEKARLSESVTIPENLEQFQEVLNRVVSRTWGKIKGNKAGLLKPFIAERDFLSSTLRTASPSRRPIIKESIRSLNKLIEPIEKLSPKEIAKLDIDPKRAKGMLSWIAKSLSPKTWSTFQKKQQVLYNPGAWINNAIDSIVTKNALKNENWLDFVAHPGKYPEFGVTGEALDFRGSKLITEFLEAKSKIAKKAGMFLEGAENIARQHNGRIAYWLKANELLKGGVLDSKAVHKVATDFAMEANRMTHFFYGDYTLLDRWMNKIPFFPYWFWGSRNAQFYAKTTAKRPTMLLKINQMNDWFKQHISVDGNGGVVLDMPGVQPLLVKPADYFSFNRFIKTAQQMTLDDTARPSDELVGNQGLKMISSVIGPPGDWFRIIQSGVMPDQTWRFVGPWTRQLSATTGITLEDYLQDLVGKNATLKREEYNRKRIDSIQIKHEWLYNKKISFNEARGAFRKEQITLSTLGLLGLYAKPYTQWEKMIDLDRAFYFTLDDPIQSSFWYKTHPWMFPLTTPKDLDLELDLRKHALNKTPDKDLDNQLRQEKPYTLRYALKFAGDKVQEGITKMLDAMTPSVYAKEYKKDIPEWDYIIKGEIVKPEESPAVEIPDGMEVRAERRKDGSYGLVNNKPDIGILQKIWNYFPVTGQQLKRNKAEGDLRSQLTILNQNLRTRNTLEDGQKVLDQNKVLADYYKKNRDIIPWHFQSIGLAIDKTENYYQKDYKTVFKNAMMEQIRKETTVDGMDKVYNRDIKDWSKKTFTFKGQEMPMVTNDILLKETKTALHTQYSIEREKIEKGTRENLAKKYGPVYSDFQRVGWDPKYVQSKYADDPDLREGLIKYRSDTPLQETLGRYQPIAIGIHANIRSKGFSADSYRSLNKAQRETLARFYSEDRNRMRALGLEFSEVPAWLEAFEGKEYTDKAITERTRGYSLDPKEYHKELLAPFQRVPPRATFSSPTNFLTWTVGQTMRWNKEFPNQPKNLLQVAGEEMGKGISEYGAWQVIPEVGQSIIDFSYALGGMDKDTHTQTSGILADAGKGMSQGLFASQAFAGMAGAGPIGIATGLATFLIARLGRDRAERDRSKWREEQAAQRAEYYERIAREKKIETRRRRIEYERRGEKIARERIERKREIEYKTRLRAWLREGARMPAMLRQPSWFLRRFEEPRRQIVTRWRTRPTFESKLGLIESVRRELRTPRVRF